MATQMHDMTEEEPDKQLENARTELRELRFQYAVARSLQNPARVGQLKRNVARILTVKNQRRSGNAPAGKQAAQSSAGKSGKKGGKDK